MTTHRDIPDEVVKRAQLYDAGHWREDRGGERGGSWGSVPPDQVRRLLWGAYGGMPAAVVHDNHLWFITEDEPRAPVVFDECDLAAIGMYEDRGEDE